MVSLNSLLKGVTVLSALVAAGSLQASPDALPTSYEIRGYSQSDGYLQIRSSRITSDTSALPLRNGAEEATGRFDPYQDNPEDYWSTREIAVPGCQLLDDKSDDNYANDIAIYNQELYKKTHYDPLAPCGVTGQMKETTIDADITVIDGYDEDANDPHLFHARTSTVKTPAVTLALLAEITRKAPVLPRVIFAEGVRHYEFARERTDKSGRTRTSVSMDMTVMNHLGDILVFEAGAGRSQTRNLNTKRMMS